jgi:quercetin dioxygenase-like cupin family protein
MINEQQQEQASLYVLGALTTAEALVFETEVRENAELRELVRSLQDTSDLLAIASPAVAPPPQLRDKVLRRIANDIAPAAREAQLPSSIVGGFRYLNADDRSGWKELPVRGAWVKLLSIERDRGYAVLLGKLEPGVRYPPHVHPGPEDLYILTGDLHISGRRLGPGDFHHADTGSRHEVNYSEEGCTLLAVVTADHPLAKFAAT